MELFGLLSLPEPWVEYPTWTAVPGVLHAGDEARVQMLWCYEAWACAVSRVYSRLFQAPLRVLSLRRYDWARDAERWGVFLSAKNTLLGEDVWAYECYPQARQVVDTANVYHLIECPIDCSLAALDGRIALYAFPDPAREA